MLKSILLLIKSHVTLTVTLIFTTTVIGLIAAMTIAVKNYELDKNVKKNLSMLTSSNFQTDVENQMNQDSQISNENGPTVNRDEPLTFRIEKVFIKQEGGNIVKDWQGNEAYEMSGEGIEYKIVPSYDKDYSKWTKAEKEAYQKMYEDVAKKVQEDYNKAAVNESNAMIEATITTQKIMNSISKEYIFWYKDSEGSVSSESWSYNSYLKLYSCGMAIQNYGEDIYKTIRISQAEYTGVTKEDFRSIVYPSLQQKIEELVQQRIVEDPYGSQNVEWMQEIQNQKQESLNELEELYYLSD